jgi:hypothetical protein
MAKTNRKKSCGKNATPNRTNFLSITFSSINGWPSIVIKGIPKKTARKK